MSKVKHKAFTYIDLFAGCGGLSLGLHNAGWKGLFAVEKSKDAFATLKFNLIDKLDHFDWPEWLPQTPLDIYDVLNKHKQNLKSLKNKVDLVTGGPPCQGFSMAGRRNENDERNKLIDTYIEFIQLIQPRMIFFENVKGFTIGFKKKNTQGNAYSSYVIDRLENDLNYKVKGNILDFSEYGIPQRRKRFILFGIKDGNSLKAGEFFDEIIKNKTNFLKTKGIRNDTSLEEAISDLLQSNGEKVLPNSDKFSVGIYSETKSKYQKLMRKGKHCKNKIADSHRFANHSDNTEKKFSYMLENAERNKSINQSIRELFKLKKRTVVPLEPSSKSPTLTTLPDDYIHYCEPRILTVREYARIQSFPDWFEIKGKYTTGGKFRKEDVPRYTQIGNAIPPLFGEQCGIILKEMK